MFLSLKTSPAVSDTSKARYSILLSNPNTKHIHTQKHRQRANERARERERERERYSYTSWGSGAFEGSCGLSKSSDRSTKLSRNGRIFLKELRDVQASCSTAKGRKPWKASAKSLITLITSLDSTLSHSACEKGRWGYTGTPTHKPLDAQVCRGRDR